MKNISLFLAIFFISGFCFSQNGGALFNVGADMNVNRMNSLNTTLSNGDVLIAGGHGTDFVSLGSAEIYSAGTFSLVQMNYVHDSGTMVETSPGIYYIFGGAANLGVAPGYTDIEYFNSNTRSFSTTGVSMLYGRMTHNAAILKDGTVLIVGGWYDGSSATYGEVFNPNTLTTGLTGAMITPRSHPIIVPTDDGKATIFGGYGIYGTPYFQNVEEYNPSTNQFSAVSDTIFSSTQEISMTYDNHLAGDNIIYNGNYLFSASNSSTSEMFFFTFDPDTKIFSKLYLDSALTYQYHGYPAWTLSSDLSKIYLLATKYQTDTCFARLYTIDLTQNKIFDPGSYQQLNTTYQLGSLSMNTIPSNNGDLILITGGSTRTDWYYNFYPVNHSLIITPTIVDVKTESTVPVSFSLSQNYPNPFNPSTTIKFAVTESGLVTLKIYDILGKEVATLVNQDLDKGSYSVNFNSNTQGLNLASGMYIYKLNSNNKTVSKKMLLLK